MKSDEGLWRVETTLHVVNLLLHRWLHAINEGWRFFGNILPSYQSWINMLLPTTIFFRSLWTYIRSLWMYIRSFLTYNRSFLTQNAKLVCMQLLRVTLMRSLDYRLYQRASLQHHWRQQAWLLCLVEAEADVALRSYGNILKKQAKKPGSSAI